VTREVTEMRGHTKHSRGFGAAWSLVLPALLVLVAGQGCEWEDSVTLPENAPAAHPWTLNFGPHAINMAVGEVVQLTFDPRTIDGTPIPLSELPEITFTTTNPDVHVDANGKLTAGRAVYSVIVTAKTSSVEGNWTISEEIRVRVHDAPFEVPAFQMELDGPSLVPINQARSYDAFIVPADAPEDTIWPLTYYRTEAPRNLFYIYNPWSGYGYFRSFGTPTIVGTAYIFGKTYEDSVTMTSTYPDTAAIYIWRATNYLNPSPSRMTQTDVTILKGGSVVFVDQNTDAGKTDVSITFDDQQAVVGGYIEKVPYWPGAYVDCPNTGKFTYSTSLGNKGTITVVDWPAQP